VVWDFSEDRARGRGNDELAERFIRHGAVKGLEYCRVGLGLNVNTSHHVNAIHLVV